MRENQVILLIGGTGFIGKNLVNTLIKSGHKLVILARDRGRVPELFFNFPQIKIIEASLNELDKIASIVDDFIVGRMTFNNSLLHSFLLDPAAIPDAI